MTVHENITELIGHTPLVELTNYERAHELPATLIGKVESFNPTGSVKDRAAQSMIDAAVEAGVLDDETVIIEPTSGNTGIGLSAIAAVRGNRIIIVMPETMSVERRNLMRAYGAELVLTEGAKGMKGAIEEAERLAAEIPNSFIPSQFSNPANPAVHERTTGPEIWEDTDGAVDILVAGVGTGGTLSGAGRLPEGAEPGHPGGGRGTGRISRALRGPRRRPQDSGHRRRVRARDAGHRHLRRGHRHRRRGGLRGRARAGCP